MQSRILAIIQARMSSRRLPGKVLLDIAGQPMLVRVVERVQRAETVDEVVVATTSDPSDNAVEALCKGRGYLYSRGSAHDVLDRYYHAGRQFGGEVIIHITADCPLIDPGVIDIVVNAFLGRDVVSRQPPSISSRQSKLSVQRSEVRQQKSIVEEKSAPWDFAANRLPPPWKRTFPIGLDTEVCTFRALERAWREASEPHQREHVMPYLYEREGRFRVLLVDHDPDYGALRWTVDTSEDLDLVRQIYAQFEGREDFTWYEILNLFQRHPELAQINTDVQHKTVHDVDDRR